MNIETTNALDIRKYFTKHSSINFLNDFTLQDVEDAKKQIYTNYYKTQSDLKPWLDRAAEKMIKDKFTNVKEFQEYAVKNTVRDTLNANYKNTISRLILIDSQYRQQLKDPETDFLIHFNTKVNNVISLELTNIQIPYSFYNIDSALGNDHFYITTNFIPSTGQPLNTTISTLTAPLLVKIPDGHYKDMAALVSEINAQIQSQLIYVTNLEKSYLSCAVNERTGTIEFKNESRAQYIFHFLTEKTKINACLGWILGFREFHISAETNQILRMDYILEARTSPTDLEVLPVRATPSNPGNIVANYIRGTEVAMIPNPKYFVLVVDDFNQTQTADTMVQPNIRPENTKATTHFTQDPLLDYLMPYNLSTYLANMPDRTLTKSQLYTIAQQNMEKMNLMLQNTRLEVHAPNQVLAMIPFESSKADWGHTYFSDKSKYVREYHSPTTLERIQIKLYDDKGNLLNLRGNSWCMSLTTFNLYKY